LAHFRGYKLDGAEVRTDFFFLNPSLRTSCSRALADRTAKFASATSIGSWERASKVCQRPFVFDRPIRQGKQGRSVSIGRTSYIDIFGGGPSFDALQGGLQCCRRTQGPCGRVKGQHLGGKYWLAESPPWGGRRNVCLQTHGGCGFCQRVEASGAAKFRENAPHQVLLPLFNPQLDFYL